MHKFDRTLAVAAGALALATSASAAQAVVDAENRYPNVGVLMVWRVDDAGAPVELRGFASATLIRERVMLTAGHFTAPVTSLGALPPSIRIVASFSPTNARDPLPVATAAAAAPRPPEATTLHEVDRQHIVAVLQRTGWRIDGPNGAARLLNMHPSTLRSRMQKLGIRRSAAELS
jgi:hypothetical protein